MPATPGRPDEHPPRLNYDMSMVAAASIQSIVNLLTELVRIPSRAGIDSYEPILDAVGAWLSGRELPCDDVVDDRGERVGVWGRIDGPRPGRRYLLNATVDTAPFGNESRWSHPPLSAARADGWLYGRGSADSKAGVAIFCHVLEQLRRAADPWCGSIAYVFDAAEHTGEFTGIRRFMESHGVGMGLDGALIGYPGNERISVGGRGFARARVRVHGESAHTGSAKRKGVNAVWRAATLVQRIQSTDLRAAGDEDFPLPPRASVTAIDGGSGFSVVPDLCTLNVDIRLTPGFTLDSAKAHLAGIVDAIDEATPGLRRTEIDWIGGYPAYRLGADTPLVGALRDAAREVLGRDVPAEVVGPSSVGNYLAGRGVPATNGFGVTYAAIHATDERVDLDSIGPVFDIYCRALRKLLST